MNIYIYIYIYIIILEFVEEHLPGGLSVMSCPTMFDDHYLVERTMKNEQNKKM